MSSAATFAIFSGQVNFRFLPAAGSAWLVTVFVFAQLATGCLAGEAAATDAEALEHFEKNIRPVLIRECIRCHGPKKQQGGLRLDSRAGWMEGGDSGPAVVPEHPEESLLIEAIRYESFEMPPRGPLPAAEIAALEAWIEAGAVDPREAAEAAPVTESPSLEQGRNFWAFQPVSRPSPPTPARRDWARSDIDNFILAKLESAGLEPNPDADAVDLVRRVYFDLTGLPPSPAQIDSFLEDDREDRLAHLVDRLLDSAPFGEQWGRHWLDVVRFAESSGGGRSLQFPNAWRYRDYVIESFNMDVPFDRFLREQLAGDMMKAEDWRERRRQLVATGFLLLGPTNYELQDKDILEMDVVDEQLDTLGKATMGMTLGCARCHDHKFDPIPMQDYYALAGIFKSTRAMIHSNVSTWNKVDLPPSPQQADRLARHQAELSAAEKALEEARQAFVAAGGNLDEKPSKKSPKSVAADTLQGVVVDNADAELIGDWQESTSNASFVGKHYIHDAGMDRGQKRVVFQTSVPAAGDYEVRVSYSAGSNRPSQVPVTVTHASGSTEKRIDQRKQPSIDGLFVSLGTFRFQANEMARVVVSNRGTVDGVVIADAVQWLPVSSDVAAVNGDLEEAGEKADAEAKARLARLEAELRKSEQRLEAVKKRAPSPDVAMVVDDEEAVEDVHLAIRGVVHNQGPRVPRGVLQVVSDVPFENIPEAQSGRKQLAEWLTDPAHPLTSRVFVNRVWYWLFGRGLVSTVDNFGQTGEPPSHSELLDYLAATFVEDDWSVKRLVRRIVLSRVYRLSTKSREDVGSGKAGALTDCRDAERFRVDPENRLLWRMNRRRLRAEEMRDAVLAISGQLDFDIGGSNIRPGSEYGYQFESVRRSVYVPVFRNALPEWFETFDFPDPNAQRGSRTSSTVASQALFLMNHPKVIEASRQAARELLDKTGSDLATRVDYAFREVLGRLPSADERAVACRFVEESPEAPSRWASLYQTLFQSIDFRYLN